jgi:MoxR-like ATPase
VYYEVAPIEGEVPAVPDAPPNGPEHPAHYLPARALVDAVNVALVLNRPLLLTGEPGTGKTQLAQSVAWQLARAQRLGVTSAAVERFEAKSTSVARDLFYSYDALGRFHAAHAGGNARAADYLTFSALGRALLEALPADKVQHLVPAGHAHVGPRRRVVLVDEIDKAPRDFPNDLLNEVDQMFFRVPELGNVQVGGPGQVPDALKPIVIITSNSEKTLPEPFLRRCVYFHIPFPEGDRLRDILLARLGAFTRTQGPLVNDALAYFAKLRELGSGKRRASPAELIQWLTYMLHRGAKLDAPLADAREHALAGLVAMTKDEASQARAREELERFFGKR